MDSLGGSPRRGSPARGVRGARTRTPKTRDADVSSRDRRLPGDGPSRATGARRKGSPGRTTRGGSVPRSGSPDNPGHATRGGCTRGEGHLTGDSAQGSASHDYAEPPTVVASQVRRT